MKTVWTAPQDRMTLRVPIAEMNTRELPLSPEALKSVRATPRRLAALAVIRMRSAAALESSSRMANSAVAPPSMRPTLTHTELMNTAAEALHPMSVATCHGIRRAAMPKARAPAPNENSTRVPARMCERLTPPSLLPASLATEATISPITVRSRTCHRDSTEAWRFVGVSTTSASEFACPQGSGLEAELWHRGRPSLCLPFSGLDGKAFLTGTGAETHRQSTMVRPWHSKRRRPGR